MDVRGNARRGLTLFLSLVVAFSIAVNAWAFTHPADAAVSIAVLMCTPALASVITRVVRREGFADVSFRFGPARTTLPWFAAAAVLPIVVGSVAYGTAWATGLADFTGTVGGVAVGVASMFVVAVWGTCVFAAGEEIGWRGYMLTRLIDAGVPRPVLASGLIWGAWHLPMVAGGFYAAGTNRLLSSVLLLISATSFAFFLARMRLESGSIWPVIFAHSAWNVIIQNPFDGASGGEGATLWVGEAGILTCVVLVVIGVVVSRGRWADRRWPPRASDGDPALSRA
ncbi:type II CAAX endopeptidase family protein [Actinomycetospora flava]|uniref:Type II CAAX endopeptidase family protein n=1 Tax=Actinomycetospora flava TaxID=3129232 RepID=A0ABU8M8R8_9PSEU